MSDFEKVAMMKNDEKKKDKDLDPTIEIETIEQEEETGDTADKDEEKTESETGTETETESETDGAGEISIELIGAMPDIKGAAKLDDAEINYPDLVPAEQVQYRSNIEELLSKTDKKGAGKKARYIINAVNGINELLGRGIGEGALGETLKSYGALADNESQEKGLSEIDETYDKALNLTRKYLSRKVVWSKAGKRRFQVIKGLQKYLEWEKMKVSSQASQLLGGTVPEEVYDRYTVGQLLEPADMLSDATSLAYKNLKNMSATDFSGGERSIEATTDKVQQIRNTYSSMAKTTGGNMNPRMTTDAVMGLGYLNGDSAQRSYQSAKNLDYDDKNDMFAANRINRVREIERIFETILQFDVNEFKLNSFEDLANPAKIKGVIMSYMAWDSESFFKDYKKWLADPDMQGVLALDQEMFQEVNAIRDASGGLNSILNEIIPQLNDPDVKKYCSEKDLDGMTPKIAMERMEKFARGPEDEDPAKKAEMKKVSNFYLSMVSILTVEADIMPGGNPQNRLAAERKSRKVDGSKVTAAIDAIRKKRGGWK